MKNKGNNNCNGCGGSVRALAASAGIQFGDLQIEAFRLREKLGPDHQKAYYEIVRQLVRGGAVSESEQRVLLELGKRGFAVGSDSEAQKFVAYVQGLHKRMLTDGGASPVALAIIGAIANYAIPSNLGRRGRALASASGKMAVSLNRHNLWPFIDTGTLAETSISGGVAPRELLESVQWADWSPDGTALAIVRQVEQRVDWSIRSGRFSTSRWVGSAVPECRATAISSPFSSIPFGMTTPARWRSWTKRARRRR